MITVDDVIQTLQAKKTKPSEEDLRHLPFKNAFIYARLSSPAQVRESHESMHEIVELVRLAIKDGYQSNLKPSVIEDMLQKIQKDITCKGVLSDGQITIDFRDLGMSGRLSPNDRPGLKNQIDTIKNGQTGAVYVSEISRFTRDQTRITPYTLVELFRQHSCRVRTPEYIHNPCIERDWDDLVDELEKGINENKTLNVRLLRKRRLKAQRGEFVGEPVIPGFIVEIKETEPSGRNIYGKYQRYAPHAKIVTLIIREFIKQGFSETKTYHALCRLTSPLSFPAFPPELKYMERLSSLRKAKRVEGVGYLITPSMITSLCTTPELIGLWTWGDVDPIRDNHEKAVPVDLWLEAFRGYRDTIKPRGRSINYEPLEWSGLLWLENHGALQKIYPHSGKEAYRNRADCEQVPGQSPFNRAARFLDQPLTGAVLEKLDFTPFAEEVLMQLETDTVHSGLELEESKNSIKRLERRLENLEAQLGWEGGKLDERLLKQIEKTENDLQELKSRPVPNPVTSIPEINYKVIRDFLRKLPQKWHNYPRTLRNRLLKRIIDRVVLRQGEQILTATIYWKTGQAQTIVIQRVKARGNHESRWKKEEFRILKELWPKGSQETILAKLPRRTWKAVAHQAYNLGLRRTPELSNHTTRRRWDPNEEYRAKQLFESGTSVTDIALNVGRSDTAVLQRSWGKGWQRLHSNPGMATTEFSSTNQNPEGSKRITSGPVFGGQVTLGIWVARLLIQSWNLGTFPVHLPNLQLCLFLYFLLLPK